MAEDQPPPGGPPRRPLPSIEVLAQMSQSELRKMSPDEQRVVMHERTKNVEQTTTNLVESVRELREQVGGVVSRVETVTSQQTTLGQQQVDMARQLADHAAKIEWLLKRMGAGGGVLGFLWIVFKLAELLTR